jgi:photosystem II stability/assembly factor-like uncharacterized protein
VNRYGRGAPLLAVADTQHLDALCPSDGAMGSERVQLYGSTDAGRSWRKAGGTHLVPSDVNGLADNGHGVLLVSAASGTSSILRSTDDGRSLPEARVSVPSGGYPWADLCFTTSTQATVTLPGHGFYVSRDAGRTWSRVAF